MTETHRPQFGRNQVLPTTGAPSERRKSGRNIGWGRVDETREDQDMSLLQMLR